MVFKWIFLFRNCGKLSKSALLVEQANVDLRWWNFLRFKLYHRGNLVSSRQLFSNMLQLLMEGIHSLEIWLFLAFFVTNTTQPRIMFLKLVSCLLSEIQRWIISKHSIYREIRHNLILLLVCVLLLSLFPLFIHQSNHLQFVILFICFSW